MNANASHRLLRAADRMPSSWKNGGGLTWEVDSSPAGASLTDFDWRISIAEVTADGPFSMFEEVDRTIILLTGEGMDLTIEGALVRLEGYVPLSFLGDARVDCHLPGGPTRDLNVMTRRGRVTTSVAVLELRPDRDVRLEPADLLVLLAIDQPVTVHESPEAVVVLQSLDALRCSLSSDLTVSGTGHAIAIALSACFGG